RRRLRQWRGVLFLPPAPRRTRTSSSSRRAISPSLRSGGGLAGGPPPRQQRRAGVWLCPAGLAMQALRRFLWLLATRTGRLDQPPFNDARGVGALDRVLRPGERTADGFLDQLASAVIGGGDGLHLHDPFGEFSRRHRPRRVTQHVVDQAKAFAGAKPAAARPRLPESDLFGTNVRIKQQHRRVEVRETGAILRQLLLQPIHNSGQLRSLVA